jgi:hypothetical protein
MQFRPDHARSSAGYLRAGRTSMALCERAKLNLILWEKNQSCDR